MHKAQIFTTPGGEEMVILAKADYDAMLAALDADAEDDADVAIYDARKAQLEAEGVLPAEISLAMLRGDNRIKAIRKFRGLSQPQVAEAAGIAQGFLSDLERGKRNLTDDVAERLAVALDVAAGWLKG